MQPIQCPRCGSEAFNNYGHLKDGQQRYICLVCERQFVVNTRTEPPQRPACPQCGKPMHVYMQYPDAVRFRCSEYPTCHGYAKIAKEN